MSHYSEETEKLSENIFPSTTDLILTLFLLKTEVSHYTLKAEKSLKTSNRSVGKITVTARSNSHNNKNNGSIFIGGTKSLRNLDLVADYGA